MGTDTRFSKLKYHVILLISDYMQIEHVHIILFLPESPIELHETDFVFTGIITPVLKNGKGDNSKSFGGWKQMDEW